MTIKDSATLPYTHPQIELNGIQITHHEQAGNVWPKRENAVIGRFAQLVANVYAAAEASEMSKPFSEENYYRQHRHHTTTQCAFPFARNTERAPFSICNKTTQPIKERSISSHFFRHKSRHVRHISAHLPHFISCHRATQTPQKGNYARHMLVIG